MNISSKITKTAERIAAVLSVPEVGEETRKHAIKAAANLRSALGQLAEVDRQSRALWDLVIASKHWTPGEIRQARADGKVNAATLVPELA